MQSPNHKWTFNSNGRLWSKASQRIAASYRILDLDEALLRHGRFDRKIKVDLPNFNERKAILEVHDKNKNLSPKINLLNIAKQTFGFSGAN